MTAFGSPANEKTYDDALEVVGEIDDDIAKLEDMMSQTIRQLEAGRKGLEARLSKLKMNMPDTGVECSNKRNCYLRMEIVSNKIKEINRAIECFKTALGEHYSTEPHANGDDRSVKLAAYAEDPFREEGPPVGGVNVAVAGVYGCARYELS